MTTEHYLTVTPEDAGLRLDKFVAVAVPELSRSRVQALIEDGCLTQQTLTITECSYRVKSGDSFTLAVPPAAPSVMQPMHKELDILFEDEDMLVINKPAGMTVHPGAGNFNDTLVNALLAHCGENLSGVGGVARPGIVHRLDKDTSGLMVVAKTDRAHHHLAAQLSTRTLKRVYTALCWGVPMPQEGTVSTQLARSTRDRTKMAVVRSGGKQATTHYTVKKVFGEQAVSQIECRLETGRTHQIRVHLTHLGHGLVGDPVYGSPHRKLLKSLSGEATAAIEEFNRQALHAAHIGFIHPVTQEAMAFSAPLPYDMEQLIALLAKI